MQLPLRPSLKDRAMATLESIKERQKADAYRDEHLREWPLWRQKLNLFVRSNVWFERVIFACIVFNCISISINTLVASAGGDGLQITEDIFTTIFVAEMALKMIGEGVLWKYGYFSSTVNVFDCTLATVSLYGMLQQHFFDGFDAVPAFTATAARSIRLLRPLRTIHILTSLRRVSEAVAASAKRLLHLMLLTSLFVLCSGIVALEFFKGRLGNTCVDPVTNASTGQICAAPMPHALPNGTNGTTWFANVSQLDAGGGGSGSGSSLGLPVWSIGSDDIDDLPTFVRGYICPWGQVCMRTGNPENGYLSFDTILPTSLTLFSVLTLEAWSVVMYYVMDAVGEGAQLYFLAVVLVGTLFLLNLVLATVADGFNRTLAAIEEHEAGRQQESLLALVLRKVTWGAGGGAPDADGDLPRRAGPPPRWRRSIIDFIENKAVVIGTHVLTLANIVMLACVYQGMPSAAESALIYTSVSMAFMLFIETVLKLVAKGPRPFFDDLLNPFEAVVSIGAVLEFFIVGTAAVNALRAVRLLRFLEISASMKRTMAMIKRAFAAAAPLLLLLFLLIFNFGLIGVQIFSGSMCGQGQISDPYFWVNTTVCDNVPRANFDNIGYGMTTVFQIIAGDGWRTIMEDAMLSRGSWAALYFVLVILVGGLLMINLIMSVLIDTMSHAADEMRAQDQAAAAPRSPTAATADIAGKGDGKGVDGCDRLSESTASSGGVPDPDIELSGVPSRSQLVLAASPCTAGPSVTKLTAVDEDLLLGGPTVIGGAVVVPALDAGKQDGGPLTAKRMTKRERELQKFDAQFVDVVLEAMDAQGLETALISEEMRQQAAVEQSKNPLRQAARVVVNSRVFTGTIVLTILFSVGAMCAAEPLQVPFSPANTFVSYSDVAVGIIFFVEAMLKITWLGPWNRNTLVHGRGYFQQKWCVFDFVMMACSAAAGTIVLFAGSSNPKALSVARWLRLFRVLRPWSLVGRNQLTSLVFKSFIAAVGSMLNLALITLCFWLIYAIIGTQIFKGTMYACTVSVWGDATFGPPYISTRSDCLAVNRTWTNNLRNFDNVGESMLTLFGVATTDSWADVMRFNANAMDFEHAPSTIRKSFAVLYAISFIVLITFLFLNMAISVLVDAYNVTRGEFALALRRSFLSRKIDVLDPLQQDFVDLYRRALVFVKPPLLPPYGPQSWRRHVRRLVRLKYFEYVVLTAALASIVIQATAFAKQPPIYDDLLVSLDLIFTLGFIAAMLLKWVGYGVTQYLSARSARIELYTNVVTLAAVIARFAVGPNAIIDLIRMLRIVRLQRAFFMSTSLKLFMDTLIASSPTVAAVLFLVFLVFFMYAAIGMRAFSAVSWNQGLTSHANFVRIDNALMTLLRVATSDNWQVLMWDCAQAPPSCNPDIGACGAPGWAQVYFISFICIGQFLGLNFFTAVLLDAFSHSERADRMQVQKRDVNAFRREWKRFACLDAADTMKATNLPLLLSRLTPPLGPGERDDKPSALAARLDMVMVVNGVVFQADVFDGLLRHYFGVALPSSSDAKLRSLLESTFRHRLASSIRGNGFSQWPLRSVAVAMRIQAAWRGRRERQRIVSEATGGAVAPPLRKPFRFDDDIAAGPPTTRTATKRPALHATGSAPAPGVAPVVLSTEERGDFLL